MTVIFHAEEEMRRINARVVCAKAPSAAHNGSGRRGGKVVTERLGAEALAPVSEGLGPG